MHDLVAYTIFGSACMGIFVVIVVAEWVINFIYGGE